MLTLRTRRESLQPTNDEACSESREGLWWSILKVEKFCLTARLDASPVGVGVGPGSPIASIEHRTTHLPARSFALMRTSLK